MNGGHAITWPEVAMMIVIGLPGFLVSLVAAYKATIGAQRADDAAKATDVGNSILDHRTDKIQQDIGAIHEVVNGGLGAAKQEIAELKVKIIALQAIIAERPLSTMPMIPPETRHEEIKGGG